MLRANPKSLVVLASLIFVALAQKLPGADEPKPKLTAAQQIRLGDASKLFDQAQRLQREAKYAEAAKRAKESLEIREQILGGSDPLVATSLNALAELDRLQCKYSEAEPHHRRALSIRESAFGPNHTKVASSLCNLAAVFSAVGKYSEAEALLNRAMIIRTPADGAEKPELATVLNGLGELYEQQGKFTEAQAAHQRALQIRELAMGPGHADVAESLNNLALATCAQGKYAEAEALYQRALKIRTRTYGPNHPDVAECLHNLAVLYREQGKNSEAEPLYRQALKIYESTLGPDHRDVAISLSNLAELYRVQGKLVQAEPLYHRVIQILEKVLGPEHADVASILNNLALLDESQGKYAEAESLYRRALSIWEQALGPDHPEVASSLNNLAELYRVQGRLAEAEPLYRKALRIREQVLSPNHPEIATVLNNLALLCNRQGKYRQAESLSNRALEIWEIALGSEHPDFALALSNVAIMQAGNRRWSAAADRQDQARRVVRRYVARELPALNAQDQLAFLRTIDEGAFHVALSLGWTRRDEEPNLNALAAGWLINGKAVAQEALAQRALWTRESRNSQVGEHVKQLVAIRGKRAALTFAAAKPGQETTRRLEIENLEAQDDELSRRVAQATGQPLQSEPWVAVEAVRNAIPADGLLIDIARFEVFNFQATSEQRQWLPARYAAWIIPPVGEGEIAIVDLGEAQAIDALVQSAREAIQKTGQLPGDRGLGGVVQSDKGASASKLSEINSLRKLANAVFEPLEAHFGKARTLILSPDSDLWLVPWAALPLNDGQYAIENYRIRYVVSGRDLVDHHRSKLRTSAPVLFANPDYDLRASQVFSTTQAVLRNAARAREIAADRAVSRSRSGAFQAQRLPGTAAEAAAITPVLKQLTHAEPLVYLDRYALEGVFKAIERPQLLIISTHGFFLSDRQTGVENSSVDLEVHRDPASPSAADEPRKNPLLRCGLLLAGCNQSKPSDQMQVDDGILTGMEIVGADLRGTELVVLSACETGIGQLHNGEGVAGLRQAFQLAGAQSIVATLWQIPDQATTQIVQAFFTNLAAGHSKAEALRDAQLAAIKAARSNTGAAPPYSWGAFTVTGE